jgi:pimeloyl-ACP methyl ester carboxylesterase
MTTQTIKVRLRPFGSTLALVLSLALLSGCKVLGMRAIPLYELQDKYHRPGSTYLEVDGTKVHYVVEGRKGAPTLVLLHGVLASLHTWDGWVKKLREHYRIVRLDLPGFGLTGPMASENYTPEYAMEFFEMFRAALAGTHPDLNLEKFHLAGNSLGGFIAWYYAANYPQHVDKLILIDPIAYPQELPFIINFASKPFWGWVASRDAPRFIIKRNVRKVYGRPHRVTDETIDRYHELLLREGNRKSMVEYFRTLKKYSTNEEICKRIADVRAPTLLMWGQDDRWVPVELVDRWRQDLRNVEVKIYETAGHIPMEEIPDETVVDAYAFLSGGDTLVTDGPTRDAAPDDDWDTPEDNAPVRPAPKKKAPRRDEPPPFERGDEEGMPPFEPIDEQPAPEPSLPVAKPGPRMPDW